MACAGARIAHFCSTCGSGPQSHEWTEDNFCAMKTPPDGSNWAATQARRGGCFVAAGEVEAGMAEMSERFVTATIYMVERSR